ncbi:MAG TPA: ankyrin repeat domain-containing protein, partial [Gammaproteobacteria bacterium]|nr:ankyrin repeat domain-containing protein [Gammaproteobacteria bacterium]
GANVDTYDQYGNIPLLNVVYNKQWKVAEALLKAGAKANILYDRDITLLMQAASTGNTTLIDMFSKAQDLKEALTARDKNFNTALMLAITNKQWGAAKALIDLGTNVNTRDRWNNTPLMLAAAYGNADIIQHIFSKIADPKSALETQNVNGDTALMLAITNKQWGSVEALIALGAKMDTQNKYGYTSMMLLLRHANLPIVQQIISSFNFSIDVMKNAQERDKLIGIIKEAGHILGFKTPVSGIAPEGLFITDEHPGCLILKKYLDKLPDTATRSKITEALDLANNFYQKNGVTDNNSNYKELMDYHQGRNCTILPIHWSSPEGDHAITLIAWNDILVICNRGDKKLKEGISVFRIPTASDDSTITQKFLETIMPKDGYVSAETVLREIRSCVGKTEIENPILTFSSLEQQHGNCGFVNLKSSLYPILSFIALLKDNKIGPENFNYTFLSPYLPQSQDPKKQQELQNIKERSKTAYKKFTKEMRDTTVKELCNEFQKLPFGSEKRGIYLEMFAAILYEHYGQEK